MSDIETEQGESPRQESAAEEELQVDEVQQVSPSDDGAVNDKEAEESQSDDALQADSSNDDSVNDTEAEQTTTNEEAADEEAADDGAVNNEATDENTNEDKTTDEEIAEEQGDDENRDKEPTSEDLNEKNVNDEIAAESQPPVEHSESPTKEPADNVTPQPPTPAGPDIDQVDAADWPEREFPVDEQRQEGSVSVVIKQSVLKKIHEHGLVDTDVEICGVMIGNGYRDSHGPFVYVEDIIKGIHSESQTAQVTFTADTWNHIHNELDNQHPDLRILGWYHTHPGFGIFLSGMDLFIHENYFSANEQLALVYDPIGGDEGLFIWRAGEAIRDGFVIEPDADDTPDTLVLSDPNPDPLGEIPEGYGEEEALIARIERLEQRHWSMVVTMFALALFALVSPMITWVFFIEPKLPEIFKGLRPVEESSPFPTPIADPEAGPRAEPSNDAGEEPKVFKPKTAGEASDDNAKERAPNQ